MTWFTDIRGFKMKHWHKGQKRRLLLPATVTLALFIIIAIYHSLVPASVLATSNWRSILLFVLYQLSFFFFIATTLQFAGSLPKLRRRRKTIFFVVLLSLLILRWISLQYHFPTQLHETYLMQQPLIFFGNAQYSVGAFLIDACLIFFLSILHLKYLTFSRNEFLCRNKYVWGLFVLIYFIVLQAFMLFVIHLIGDIVCANNIIVNPCELIFFNTYSCLLLFAFFFLLVSYGLLARKLLHICYHFYARKKSNVLIGQIVTTIAVVTGAWLIFPDAFAIPLGWLILAMVTYQLWVFFLTFWRTKVIKFAAVIGNAILYSAALSVILHFSLGEKETLMRTAFLDEVISSDLRYENQDTVGMSDLRDLFQEIYAHKEPPLSCTWIAKSPRFLNRAFLNGHPSTFAKYSFAYFENGKIVDQYGLYDYKVKPDNYLSGKKQLQPYQKNVFRSHQHYAYQLGNERVLVISVRKDMTFDLVASMAFFFITFTILYLLIQAMVRLFLRVQRSVYSLYNNLLWATLLSVLVICLVACWVCVQYYFNQQQLLRNEQLVMKAGSMQRQFIRTEGVFEQFQGRKELAPRVQRRLVDLSHIFYADIALYDARGKMMFTSDSSVWDGEYCLPVLVAQHFKNDYSYCTTTSVNEDWNVLTLYKVITNRKNEICGYLALQDIKSQNLAQARLSALITKCLRVYAFLIILALVAVWLIYRLVAHLMGRLGRALENKKRRNEPIRVEWDQNEAVGRLIREHNRVVAELRASAELLAKSERETAWREMAKEIAHEIKNPLTPMKLKIQMLERSWQMKKPDFDLRLSTTTNEILDQIDALTDVADIFSEFAATQQSVNKEEDLVQLTHRASDTLTNTLTTHYEFKLDDSQRMMANVDANLFVKMLEYLVKNSNHNRRDDGKLNITVSLGESEEEGFWQLVFHANDRGLDDENPEQVFTVKFTEANAGHSLCLPIVKNIVTGFSGSIRFRSVRGDGTIFYIDIPKAE